MLVACIYQLIEVSLGPHGKIAGSVLHAYRWIMPCTGEHEPRYQVSAGTSCQLVPSGMRLSYMFVYCNTVSDNTKA